MLKTFTVPKLPYFRLQDWLGHRFPDGPIANRLADLSRRYSQSLAHGFVLFLADGDFALRFMFSEARDPVASYGLVHRLDRETWGSLEGVSTVVVTCA